MHRSRVSVSPAFEAIARGAQFRDLIAVVIKASPDAIFQALREVTLRDMKLAWLLGELRYLPSRLAGRMPAADSTRPFLSMLLDGGTLVLRDEAPREMITGSAARLHRVHQAPQRFANREAFEAFNDPEHEKLFMSVRVAPTGRPGEHWLVLEHATRALSPIAEREFARYWRVIKPLGACVTWQLLRAVRRRAERDTANVSRSCQPWPSVRATAQERTRTLPGDERIPEAIDTLTHAVTIRRPPRDVWPWLLQMGAGSRAGWYVNSFMRWAGFRDIPGENDARPVLYLMYLGMKHFRMPTDTLRIAATPLSDDELRTMRMPVLLLMGDREVIYDAAEALARARRLIPDFEGALVSGCRHDMCFSQHRFVDARVRAFLEQSSADAPGERSVA